MDAQSIIDRYDRLKADRGNWDSYWQECADYGMPGNNQITRKVSGGQKRTQDLFDSTAEESNIQLSAGIYSYMFPSETRAFALQVDKEEVKEIDAVKQFLDTTTGRIHEKLVNSNFREAFFEFLMSLGCFGTACLYVEKGRKVPLYFVCHHTSTICIDINSDGQIDTVYRHFEYNARQAMQEFGDNCPEKIKEAYKDPKHTGKFKFVHAVFPREERDPEKQGPLNMEWASYYVNLDEKQIVSESGYWEMPYFIVRFYKDSFENYGRSPMMKKLPDIKMINRMAKVWIKANEKMCDPPIILPDDGSISQVATQPGGVIYKRAGADDPKWFEYKGNMQQFEQAILRVQTTIFKGFYGDKFDPLIDRQNMTATEVMARIDQTIRFLTPIIGRLQSELFNPMIHRIIGILSREQLLPEMPPELSEENYSIIYLGRIALALKTLESEGLRKTLTGWSALGEAGITSWLDNLDMDKAFRDDARNNGTPATWLKDTDLRDKERQAKQQMQQAQMLAEQLPNVAKAYKQGTAKPEEGSLSEMVVNNAT